MVGGFYLEIAETAEREATEAFVAWLRNEVPRELEIDRRVRGGRRVAAQPARRV